MLRVREGGEVTDTVELNAGLHADAIALAGRDLMKMREPVLPGDPGSDRAAPAATAAAVGTVFGFSITGPEFPFSVDPANDACLVTPGQRCRDPVPVWEVLFTADMGPFQVTEDRALAGRQHFEAYP